MAISRGKAAKWLARGAVTGVPALFSPAAGVVGGALGVAAEGGARVLNKAAKNPTNPASRALFTTIIGGAAAAGAASEIANPDGPYGDIAESLTGERDYIKYRAGVATQNAFDQNDPMVNQGPLDYHQGATVNPQALNARRRGRAQAPDGSMVWGMYNTRRGYY